MRGEYFAIIFKVSCLKEISDKAKGLRLVTPTQKIMQKGMRVNDFEATAG
jgi:hypothetical protein